ACGPRPPPSRPLFPYTTLFRSMMLYVEPRTLVLRLVLRPNDFLGIRVLAELGLEGLVRERIQLFHSNDRDIVATCFLAGIDQVVIDLARADDDAGHGCRIQRGVGLADDRQELPGR